MIKKFKKEQLKGVIAKIKKTIIFSLTHLDVYNILLQKILKFK